MDEANTKLPGDLLDITVPSRKPLPLLNSLNPLYLLNLLDLPLCHSGQSGDGRLDHLEERHERTGREDPTEKAEDNAEPIGLRVLQCTPIRLTKPVVPIKELPLELDLFSLVPHARPYASPMSARICASWVLITFMLRCFSKNARASAKYASRFAQSSR